MLAQVMAQVPERRQLSVRMHPHDAQQARERLPHYRQSGIEHIDIADDPNLARGAIRCGAVPRSTPACPAAGSGSATACSAPARRPSPSWLSSPLERRSIPTA